MAVVAVGLLGVEVVGADDGCVGDHLTAGCHTQIAHVIRHGAAQATHQPTCRDTVRTQVKNYTTEQ